MKKLVRLFPVVLIIAIVLTVPGVAITAENISAMREESLVKAVVSGFLEDKARNEWLYEDNNLSVYMEPISTSTDAIKARHRQTYIDVIDILKEHRQNKGKIRESFSVEYNFQNVSIGKDTAEVDVYEAVSYFIVNGNGMPTYIGENIRLYLTKINNKWYISDIDAYENDTYTLYKNSGVSLDVIQSSIQSAQTEFIDRVGSNLVMLSDGEAIYESDLNRNTNSATTLVSYNSSDAIMYAQVYSTGLNTTAGASTYYNGNFANFYAYNSDCANFVSQCIWAGFGGDNSDATSTLFPHDSIGNTNWYYNTASDYDFNWTFAYYLGTYAESIATAPNENGWYATVYEAANAAALPTNITLAGSAFLVTQNASDPYQHAIFITSALSRDPADIYFCAHTSNHKNACLDDFIWCNYQIKVIRPVAFRRINQSCTGHTYSQYYSDGGVDVTCNVCGESRMAMGPVWSDGVVNTSKVLVATERNHLELYRLYMEIQDAQGNVVKTYSDFNKVSVGGSHTFTTPGLYTVVLKVWDSEEAYDDNPFVPTQTYMSAIRIN